MVINSPGLKPYLELIWEETRNNKSNFLFCRVNDLEGFSKQVFPLLEEMAGEDRVRVSSLRDYHNQPYYPILDFIREAFPELSLEAVQETVKKAGVYLYHQSILTEYLVNGYAIRREEMIQEEAQFEQERMMDSIIKLLKWIIGNDPFIIFIEAAHLLPPSSIDFINVFLNMDEEIPLFIVMSYMNMISDVTRDMENPWDNLVMQAETQGIHLNFANTEGEIKPFEIQRIPDPQFRDGWNAYYLLAFKDCKRTFQEFIDQDLYRKARKQVRMIVWRLMGKVAYLEGDFDTAIQCFQNALNVAQQLGDINSLANAYRRLGLAYLAAEEYSYAQTMCERAKEYASMTNDVEAVFYACFLEFLLKERAGPYYAGNYVPEFHRLINLAKSLNLENTLSFIYTSNLGTYLDYRNNTDFFVKKGLKILKGNDNILRLSSAYHNQGLVRVKEGDAGSAEKFYRKCKRLKLKLRRLGFHAQVYNSVGFFYLVRGQYARAQKEFFKALNSIVKTDEYRESAMSLYNICQLGLLTQQNNLAYISIENCFSILKNLGLSNLGYHSNLQLLVLQGLSYLLNGQSAKSWQVFMKIELEATSPTQRKNEEDFFQNLYFGALKIHEHQIEKGIAFFKDAENYLESSREDLGWLKPWFYFYLFSVFKELGRNKEAKAWLEQCCNVADLLENQFYLDLCKKQQSTEESLFGQAVEQNVKLPNVDWAIASTRMAQTVKSLRKRIDDIYQLNSMLGIVNEIDDDLVLIQRSIDLMYTHFELDFDALIYFKRTRMKYHQLYTRERITIEKNQKFAEMIDFLTKLKTEIRFELVENLGDYHSILKGFGAVLAIQLNINREPGGLIIGFTRKGETSIRPELLQIFSLASRQLALGLDRSKQNRLIISQNAELKQKNELLRKSSTTDFLTGLGNRAKLYSTLDFELSRLRRYSSSHDVKFRDLSLLFLDLDNFKFFNDSFGHAVGDLILREVALTIGEVIRDIDSAFRYGGDEFVILLPETDSEGASNLGKRIIAQIEGANNYIKEIEQMVAYSITIPKDQLLSCSIGITQVYSEKAMNIDADELLNQSDRALYKAKLMGKSQVMFFDML